LSNIECAVEWFSGLFLPFWQLAFKEGLPCPSVLINWYQNLFQVSQKDLTTECLTIKPAKSILNCSCSQEINSYGQWGRWYDREERGLGGYHL